MIFDRLQFQTALEKFSHLPEKLKITLYLYDTIPSTNQKIWQLIDRGNNLPIVAIAREQTAGRGQWGRKWQSTPGGLYLSIGIATAIDPQNADRLTIATATAIAHNLREYNIPVLLKWPNDLILFGKKLGGIKIETRQQQETITRSVIGVGINWDNIVPEVGINLKSYSSEITSLEMLAAITVAGILRGYQNYLDRGIKDILPSYLEILDSIDRKVSLKGIPGKVIGVNPNGQLRVILSSAGATTEILLGPGQISLGYLE
ncbi:MAG: biotin--[acetyl-CoA-carboxylase] ligase [Prochloraceae cyanobacterium]